MAGSPSPDAVDKFLKANPNFAKEWFAKNATPEMVQDVGHASGSASSSNNPNTRRYELRSKVDRAESSLDLAANMFKDYIEGNRQRKISTRRLDIKDLRHMDEEELFMELIRDIANELDVNVLCHKILLNVSILTNSDRGSLFLAKGSISTGTRYLVSKLFDVTAISTLEDSLRTSANEFRVPFGKGIAGYVAQTKKFINIKEAYDDPRFNKAVDQATGYRTHSILCMPVLNYDGEVIGVAQIINKASGEHEFSRQDEQVFQKYLTFCGIGIMNAQLFEMSVEEYKRNKLLLSLAKGIFAEQSSMDKLIRKIMLEAHDLLKCERCIVHLIDTNISTSVSAYFQDDWKEKDDKLKNGFRKKSEESKCDTDVDTSDSKKKITFSKIYDMMAKDGSDVETPEVIDADKWRVSHIAREIAVGQKVVNIADFEADGRFGDLGVADDKGFVLKSLLCMPVFDSEGHVIGVAQMMNKLDGQVFADSDVNIFEAFAIFCGLGIHNTEMYENACKLMAKQTVALEVLSYHATAQPDEVDKLMAVEIPSAEEYNLYSYAFNDIPQTDIETVMSVIRMFLDANIPNVFHVPYDVLCRWTLSVKKNYRPVIYHNWRHAFNVTQTMFTMIYTGNMNKYMNDLEIFALLVACLCHDLDHRGTNNAFQSKTDSPLALLYSTSTMEHHHFDHCIMILNSEGNNIFQSMSPNQYRTTVKILESAIISTDLALYFKKRGDFQKLVDAGEHEWKESYKKDLLRGMMMTACDVAAICKPWEVQQEVANLVASEFFEQGDMEKSQLNIKPIAMMDREKKDELPKMQVGFIDAICTPVYKILSSLFPGLKPLYDGCMTNRNNWQKLAENPDEIIIAQEEATQSDPPSKKPKISGDKGETNREERNNQINKDRGKKKSSSNENSSAKYLKENDIQSPNKKGNKSKTCCLL